MNILKHSPIFVVGVVCVAVAVSTTPVQAAPSFTIVDQSNANFNPSLFQNIQAFSPIGQEFIPNLLSLNFVDLFTANFGGFNNVSNLFVNIHQGTITGPIVGTSSLVTLSSTNISSSDISSFDFASPVPLVPNNLYVIEAVLASGGARGIGSSGGPLSSYPGGNQILNGVPQPNNDLWFREGIKVPIPEPSSVLGILTFGILAGLFHSKKLVKRV